MAAGTHALNLGDDDALPVWQNYARSSTDDRRRLGIIREHLSDETAVHWVALAPDDRARGRMNLALVTQAMGVAA